MTRQPDPLSQRFLVIVALVGVPLAILLGGLAWQVASLAQASVLTSHEWALISRRAGIEQLVGAAEHHVSVMRRMLEDGWSAGAKIKGPPELPVPATLEDVADPGRLAGAVLSPPGVLADPAKRGEAAAAAALFPLLSAGHQTQSSLRWSYVFDAERAYVAIYPWAPIGDYLGAPAERARKFASWFDYDVFQSVTPAKNPTRSPIWTPVYVDAGGAGLMVSHVAPVYADGFRAMVGADVLVSYLSAYLKSFPPIEGEFVLLDQAGSVVATDQDGGAGPAVRKGAAVLAEEPLPSRPDVFAERAGEHVIWSAVADTPWRLVHTVPQSVVTGATLASLAPYLAMAAGLLASLAALYVLLRRDFVRPAVRLAAYVQEASGGSPPPPDMPAPWASWVKRVAAALSEQSELVARLKETETLRAAVIDAVLDGVIIADKEGLIIGFNAGAERIFGLPASAALGRPVSEVVVPPDSRAAHEAGMARFNETRVPRVLGRKLQLQAQRADGALFPAELAIQHVETAAGSVFAAYIRDLTDQRAAESEIARNRERLHQLEKLSAMGSLLAGVAHELNNPLAIVVAQSTLLAMKADTEDLKRRADRIHGAAERCGRIVKSFLAMARQQAERREPVSLNRLVASASEMVAYGRRSAGVALHLDLAPNLPDVSGDPDLLGQVAANLMVNSAQALQDRPEPREIWARTAVEGDKVVMTVADNGPGVPPDARDQIFEPYFTTKPAGVGTGIGLSICRRVVASHAGTIEVGDRPGGGALFRVVLPTLASDRQPSVEPQVRTSGAGRILVVDDEPDVAESLAEILEDSGHAVSVLSSPRAALDRLKREPYDAVFADLRMPELSGMEFRAAIRGFDPRLAERTVVMTGDTIAGPGLLATQEGCVVLEKPFGAPEVAAALAALPEEPRLYSAGS